MIFFLIEKSVALDAAARDANDFPMFNQFVRACGLAVPAKKIVPARGVEAGDANVRGTHDSAEKISCSRRTS